MRVVIALLLAVALASATASENAETFQLTAGADAEGGEGETFVVNTDSEDAEAEAEESEAGEFDATVIDDSEDGVDESSSSEDAVFMEEESESEEEDQELAAEEDEADNEAEDQEETAEEEEIEAVDSEIVEEENVDVFAEVTDGVADTLTWLNLARAADSKVVDALTVMKGWFTDKSNPKIMVIQPGNIRLQTSEGVKAVDEAIAAIKQLKKDLTNKKIQPLPVLTIAKGLTKSAAAHVKDQGPSGKFSHTGTDGSDPFARMKRFGSFTGTAGENMGSGFADGKSIVMQYLVDDSVPSRGHRKNVLSAAFKKVGIAIGAHKVYKYMNVNDFATAYVDKA